MLSIIAALGKNRTLGKGNDLLWRIPEDLKRFKALTTGHPVVMGRKTYESIGKPLPNRTNIVITRDVNWRAEEVFAVNSLNEALTKAAEAPGGEEIFIIGGGEIYAQALPRADRLYLTLISEEKSADVFFPAYEKDFSKRISDELGISGTIHFQWVTLER